MWSRSGAVWLIVLLLIAGCTAASGLRPPSQRPARPPVYPALLPKPPEATRTADGIVYRLSVNRAVYRQGEPIVIDFAVKNTTKEGALFGATAPRLTLKLPDGELVLWRERSDGEGTNDVLELTSEYLMAGLTKIYQISWDQRDGRRKPVAPGSYALTASFPRKSAGRDHNLDPRPTVELTVNFSISPRGGARGPISPRPGVRASLTTDKQSYALGEPVKLRLVVTNESAAPLTFRSNNSQRYDFSVRAGERELWRWSQGRMFAMMVSSWQIPPGESVTYEATWQPDPATPPGTYTVEGEQKGGGSAQAQISLR